MKINEGKLVANVYRDPHFPTGYILFVDNNAFFLPGSRIYKDANSVIEALRPLKFYNRNNLRTCIKQYEYIFLSCVPEDGFKVKIGRPVTENELKGIIDENNLSEDDISEIFETSKGNIYGSKYAKTYRCVQVQTSNAIGLEKQLVLKGIEAANIAPDRVNIRVQ